MVLEPEAAEVCRANSKPPLIFQLPPWKGRMELEQAQSTPIAMYPADVRHIMVDTGKWGEIRVYTVAPKHTPCSGNVIFYIHGAGWVFGSFHTHEKLVRELSAPDRFRSDISGIHPIAGSKISDGDRAVLFRAGTSGRAGGADGFAFRPGTLTVAGDSVGGNMAIAMTLMTKYRQGPYIQKQLLYYPVTNACFNTESYCRFARGYYLYRKGMMWFWDQYSRCPSDRTQITASPLRASVKQLKGLPDAMILNGEADVLRDEGEAYANRLRKAGVDVTAMRFQGIIHDFVMLNALDQTKACRAAMDASVSWVNRKNEKETDCKKCS